MVKKIAFTLYPVRDMARARRFYGEGLGLPESDNYENRWVEFEIAGGVFAICDMPEVGRPAAGSGGSIAFEVDDVDATVARLEQAGAQVLTPAFDTPVCRMSIVGDPEGNAVCIHKVTA